MNKQNKKFEALEELAAQADLDNGWVAKALQWLSIDWDQELADSLHNYLINEQDGNYFLQDTFELPSKQDEIEGELKLGKLLGKEEIELRHDISRLHMHVLVGGTSGSGKTNFAKVLIEELIKWTKRQ